MRELLKHATTNELRLLMNTFMDTESTTSDQVDMLFAVVDELTERGELPKKTEYETQAALEKMKAMIRERENHPQTDEDTEPAWMDDLRADLEQDRLRRKARRRPIIRTSLIAASLVLILFLSNAVALANGHDLFGSIARWSKDAVYFVFGSDSDEDPAKVTTDVYIVLKLTLADIGIKVDLPTYMPDGFVFDSIEPENADGSTAIYAWFTNGSDLFSITINKVSDIIFSESNGKDYTEIYTAPNGEYMITVNENRIKAVWFQGIYEISVQGNISYDELTKILDSI